jgi:hypothetical protein
VSDLEIEGMLNALPAMDRTRYFFYRIRCLVHDCSHLPLLFDEELSKFVKPSIYLEMGLKRVKTKMDMLGVGSSISAYKHKSRNPLFNWEKTFTVFENKVDNLLSNNIFCLSIIEFKQKKILGRIEIPLKNLTNFRPIHMEMHLADWVKNECLNKLRPMETLDSELDEEEMAKSNLQLLTQKVKNQLEQLPKMESVKQLKCPKIRFSLVLESPLANMTDYIGESVEIKKKKNKSKLKKFENLMEESLIESIYAEPTNHLDLLEVVVKDLESVQNKKHWPTKMNILRIGLGFGAHSGPNLDWLHLHDLMEKSEIEREINLYNSVKKSRPVYLSKYFKKDCVKTDIFYKALAVFVVPKDIFRLGGARIFIEIENGNEDLEKQIFVNRGFNMTKGPFDVVIRNGKFEFKRRSNNQTKDSGERQDSERESHNQKISKPRIRNGDGILIELEEGRKKRIEYDPEKILKDMKIVPQYIMNFSLKDLKSNYNTPKNGNSSKLITPFIKQTNKYKLKDPEADLNYFEFAHEIHLKMSLKTRIGLPNWMIGFTKEIQEMVWRMYDLRFEESVSMSLQEEDDGSGIWKSIEKEENSMILKQFMTKEKPVQKNVHVEPGKVRWIMDVNCFKLPFKWCIEDQRECENLNLMQMNRMNLKAVLGFFPLKLSKSKPSNENQISKKAGDFGSIEKQKEYQNLIKKNMIMLEKLGNVGDTWRVLSREISQKNDMINRMSCEVREKEGILKETCKEICQLKDEIKLIERQQNLVERKLKCEEELTVKGLLHVELEHLNEDELKIKLMRVAKLYETERKVNDYYEGMMRQTLLDLGKVKDLEKEFEDLQEKQFRGGKELLRLQEEAGKVELYQETMIRQEKNIILMEKLLEECISEAKVGTDLSDEIMKVRKEVEEMKSELERADEIEEEGERWGEEMRREEEQVDKRLEELEKQRYQLERNLLEKRPIVQGQGKRRKEEQELETKIFHSKMRVKELEEELKNISKDYLDKQETLKEKYGNDPVFEETRVKDLENKQLRFGDQRGTWELLNENTCRKGGHCDYMTRSKHFLEKKLRAFSKDIKDAQQIVNEGSARDMNKENMNTVNRENGMDLLFTKEEQKKLFNKK